MMGIMTSKPKYAVSLPLCRARGYLEIQVDTFKGKEGCEHLDFLYRVLAENDGRLRVTQELVVAAKSEAAEKFGEEHPIYEALQAINVNSQPKAADLTEENLEELEKFDSDNDSSSNLPWYLLLGAGVTACVGITVSAAMHCADGGATAATATKVATAKLAGAAATKATIASLLSPAATGAGHAVAVSTVAAPLAAKGVVPLAAKLAAAKLAAAKLAAAKLAAAKAAAAAKTSTVVATPALGGGACTAVTNGGVLGPFA